MKFDIEHQYFPSTLHYRLRGSMGFEKYKKWTKVDFALFDMVMTQILHPKNFITFFENKFGQN